MEQKLIDKEQAYQVLSEYYHHRMPIQHKALREALDRVPVVEAEPVRHGKWNDIDSQMYTWKVRCNQCGHERSMMSTQGRYPKYCENCGAKMVEL